MRHLSRSSFCAAMLLFGFALFAVSTAFATTIHVPSQQPTIQAGINAAVNGDTVLVAPGVYTGTFSFGGKNIVVCSELGPLHTTVNGSSQNDPDFPTVLFNNNETEEAVLEGFTFKGGPVAITCGSNAGPTIRRNILTDQTYSSWAAMIIFGPSNIVSNTICYGANGGIAVYTASAKIINNVVAFNRHYGIASNDIVPILSYNNVYGQSPNYGNMPEPIFPSLSVDPQFVDKSLRDFRLTIFSQCIDAGNPLLVYNDPDGSRGDIGALYSPHAFPYASFINFGESTFSHLIADTPIIYWQFEGDGATQSRFEIQVGTDLDWSIAEQWSFQSLGTSDTAVLYQGLPLLEGTWYYLRMRVHDGATWGDWTGTTFRLNSTPSIPELHWPPSGATVPTIDFRVCCINSTDSESDSLTYDFQISLDSTFSTVLASSDLVLETTDITCSAEFQTLNGGQIYWWRCRSFDGRERSEWSAVSSFTAEEGFDAVIRVPAERPTIQAGIDVAQSGDTILVAPGTYQEVFAFNGKSVVVTSEGGAAVTKIIGSADNSLENPTVRFTGGETSNSILSGFTFAGGGIAVICASGSSPIISHNVFTDQKYSSWAALVIVGAATIRNNTICYGANGGIATYNAGGIIEGNIVAFNGNYGIANGGDYPTLAYNNVFGQPNNYAGIPSAGTGSISYNPQFADAVTRNLHLSPSSPCINAGNPNPFYNDPDGSRNDMGAFPYVPPIAPPILASIGAKSASEGALLSFNIVATDANGTTPSLDAPALPQGATFVDSANGHGNFSWTPTYAQAGGYDVLFIASDGALADSEMVHITVQNVIRPPVIDSVRIDGQIAFQHILNATPQFRWRYTDPEGLPQDSFLIAVGTDNDWQFAEKWNPAPFASADTFVVYDGSALLDGQTYYLRLRVHNSLAWSDWYQTSFRMNSVPTAPTIRTPNNLVVTGSTPTLWITNGTDAQNDPLTYEFAGFHDTDCVAGPDINLLGVAQTADSTGGQITVPLAENCRYFWRARAYDGFEYSAWTPLAQFLVNGTPEAPTAPTLDSPPLPDNKPVFTLLPTLTWLPSYDPDPADTVRYKLELSDRANFSFALVRDSLSATNLPLVDSLEFGTHYWWRVTARDKSSLTAQSSVKEFWTWKPGDMNHSHGVDLTDLSLLVAYLVQTPRPVILPKMVADLTSDCRIDLSDLSTLIAYMTMTGIVLQPGCE